MTSCDTRSAAVSGGTPLPGTPAHAAGFGLLGVRGADVGDAASLGAIAANFGEGFACAILGRDQQLEDGTVLRCGHAAVSTWTYILTVCAFNVLMLWVIREGTVCYVFIANAVTTSESRCSYSTTSW